MKKSKWTNLVADLAIVLVSLASLFATVSWIASSKASGPASDSKTAALGIMILRLESETDASNYLTQAQMSATLASISFARAEATDNLELKSYLDNLGYTQISLANFYTAAAENAKNKANSYYDNYSQRMADAAKLGGVADMRSTAALIFTATAIVGSSGTLLKRREVVYLAVPIFIIAAGFFVWSFLI
ncbi:MAG: hypothetical protein AB1305_00255 [Candidatus Hadarchaeota archaeon]